MEYSFRRLPLADILDQARQKDENFIAKFARVHSDGSIIRNFKIIPHEDPKETNKFWIVHKDKQDQEREVGTSTHNKEKGQEQNDQPVEKSAQDSEILTRNKGKGREQSDQIVERSEQVVKVSTRNKGKGRKRSGQSVQRSEQVVKISTRNKGKGRERSDQSVERSEQDIKVSTRNKGKGRERDDQSAVQKEESQLSEDKAI